MEETKANGRIRRTSEEQQYNHIGSLQISLGPKNDLCRDINGRSPSPFNRFVALMIRMVLVHSKSR